MLYINVDALVQAVDGHTQTDDKLDDDITCIMENLPKVDVVMCKDCKFYKEQHFPSGKSYGWFCDKTHYARNETDFCSRAERKDA